MKKIAALYDIHGNLPALNAVLAELEREGAEQLVIGGDVVAGPMPRETLERLEGLNIPKLWIQGNGDTEIAAAKAGQPFQSLSAGAREVMLWAAEQLTPEQGRKLAGWPLTVTLELPGLGRVLFCHATPQNNADIFTVQTPETELLPWFAGVNADVVVCGHTHLPFDRRIGKLRVLNAGSVGMPYGQLGAFWLLLDGPEVQFRRTPYDYEAAAEQIRRTGYPQAQKFAAENVQRVPDEASALAALSRLRAAQQQ